MSDLTPTAGPAPWRGFTEAVRICLRKYVTFSGRASRSEYWFFVLAAFLANLLTALLDYGVIRAGWPGNSPFTGLLNLAVFLPGLAVLSRRFHDAGWSFWWYLFGFVPIFGWLFSFIILIHRPDPRPNQFDAA